MNYRQMRRLVFPDQTQGLAVPGKPVLLTKSVVDGQSLVREMMTVQVVIPCFLTMIVTVIIIIIVVVVVVVVVIVVIVVTVIIIIVIITITITITIIGDSGGGERRRRRRRKRKVFKKIHKIRYSVSELWQVMTHSFLAY